MMVFPAHMHPKALVQNGGKPFPFTCDICGAEADGIRIRPQGRDHKDWAILPDEWTEVEDRRPHAKKPFVICCQGGRCQHEALSHAQ